MNVYLAASVTRRIELRGYASELRALGYVVTSRWLWYDNDEADRRAAERDLDDIVASRVFVLFSDPAPERGGKHFETGFAYALGKRIIVIGRREVLFHYLPGVTLAPDWHAALGAFNAGRC